MCAVCVQAFAADAPSPRKPAPIFFTLQESAIQERGQTRAEWNYTFLRDNREDRVFNASQAIGTRSNHRKTHLVTWRIKHGLSDRLQPETEIVYKAFRQHTHGDGDTHDRNDDGDFERLFGGLSFQALRESDDLPDLRLRAGALIPRRAETEGIGEEAGFDLLAVLGKQVEATHMVAAVGFAMTFDNHDHPADPDFNQTPISKGHDLRTLVYGVGLTRALADRWQVNLELDGRAFDTIQLNRRIHESELTVTPGVVYSTTRGRWDGWVGVGLPIGLSDDTDHIGVAIRTGARF